MSLVSIVIPIYKVEKELPRCLDSVLKQTYTNIEVLMIDDGSPDGSGGIAKAYALKDSRFIYFKKENGGLSDARNYGIERASGEFLFFLDSDDYIANETIEKLVSEVEKHDLDVVLGNAIKEYEVKSEDLIKNQRASDVMTGEDYFAFAIKNKQYSPVAWNGLYKAKMIKEKELYFVKGLLHEDMHWKPRVLLSTTKVKFIDDRFYHYIIRKESITQTKDLTQNIKDSLWIYQDLERYYISKEKEIKEENFKLFRNELANLYIYSLTQRVVDTIKFKQKVDTKFLHRNAQKGLTRIKVFCFLLNPMMYCQIKVKLRKLKG